MRISINMIQQYISNTLCIPISSLRFIRISDDEVSEWRHACVKLGVSILQQNSFNTGDGRRVRFGYCSACNEVVYCIDGEVLR